MAEKSLLRTVPARDTWAREQDFVSEWLSDSANLEQLGKVARLELASCEVEVRTNQGWADMLCREGKHDANVVVEAQFGSCDMDHVGRLLEYSVDLEASHSVMVAEKMTYPVLELYSNIGIWKANCRLHLVEFSVLENEEGEVAGVLLRKPDTGLLARGKSVSTMIDLPIKESKDKINEAVVEALKAKYPSFKKSPSNAQANCQGKLAELPRRHGSAKGCLSVALWPSTADERHMAYTMAHASRVSTGVLLVLLPRRSERICQLLACMQAIAGAKTAVTAQRWKWQARADGKVVEAVFNTIEIGQGDTKAAQAVRASKRRRDFWKALAKAVAKGSLVNLLPSNAKNTSAWHLGYMLGRAGFNLMVSYSQTKQRYFMELRVHSSDPCQTDNWFEQLQRKQDVISDALACEFELFWSRRGLLRARDAVVRCSWRKYVGKDDAHSLQDVPALAEAVHKVERALLKPVLDVEEYSW